MADTHELIITERMLAEETLLTRLHHTSARTAVFDRYLARVVEEAGGDPTTAIVTAADDMNPPRLVVTYQRREAAP